MGFKVGVLDADIYGPSIPTMLDMEGARPLSINVDGASKMEPIENYGVKVLSIGFYPTRSSCDLARSHGGKSFKSNDF